MTERYIFPSHLSLAYRYFVKKIPDVLVARDEPPEDWDKDTPIVLITDGGGGRIHHHQLAERRISFEVRAPDGEMAETLAMKTFDAMRVWPYEDDPIYLPGDPALPQFFPVESPRLPAYVWTVTVTIKSTTLAP